MGADVNEAKIMLATMIESLPPDVAEMEKYYQAKELVALGKTAHRIHGGVAYTGAVRLQKALRILVDQIRLENYSEVEKLYQNVCKEIENVITEFKKL